MTTPDRPTLGELTGLQELANGIKDPNQKLAHVRWALGFIAAQNLLDHQFIVSSELVFANRTDTPPQELIKFEHGLFFIGRLDHFSYMLDPDLPIDSLSLNFTGPDVIGVLPEDVPSFKQLQLRVPVLSIDTFADAEAA